MVGDHSDGLSIPARSTISSSIKKWERIRRKIVNDYNIRQELHDPFFIFLNPDSGEEAMITLLEFPREFFERATIKQLQEISVPLLDNGDSFLFKYYFPLSGKALTDIVLEIIKKKENNRGGIKRLLANLPVEEFTRELVTCLAVAYREHVKELVNLTVNELVNWMEKNKLYPVKKESFITRFPFIHDVHLDTMFRT